MATKNKDYVAIAKRYAEGVVSGRIVACDWVHKACRRQLEDLKRKQSLLWPYKFDRKAANRICRVVENMPHIEGEWAKRGELLVMQRWQIFILTTIFGWVWKHPKWDVWVRRFTTVYIEMGRKNGKSTTSAPVGIYLMALDGEMGQEVYSAATTRDQAKEVWEPAWKMVQRDPEFCRAFGVDISAHSIYQLSTGSKFIPISAEGNSLDGLNGSSIIDELHAHRNAKVWEALETAKGARKQPLIWAITTAGSDRSGICYRQRSYVTQILNRAINDESYFGIIYTIDEGDDWKDEKIWLKANPNLGVSLEIEELRRLARKASKMASEQNNFLTKHLSVWVNADVALFNISKWQALTDPSLDPDQFKDDPCWIGLDFAPIHDFTSRVILFRRELDDGAHFYCFARHFLSEGEVEDSDNAQYAGWAREGWIRTNPGNQTDDRNLEEDVVGLIEAGYQIREIDCDPSRLQGVQARIAKRTGASIVDILQNVKNLSEPTKKLMGLIADSKIHHNGDPVLAWMMSNVVGHWERKETLFPTKERRENKIDGAIALITALSRAMINAQDAEPAYQYFFL